MKDRITQAIRDACEVVFKSSGAIEITRTDEQFGDYATPVALSAAKQLGKNPRELAEQLAYTLNEKYEDILSANVAGPGYVNIRVNDELLHDERTKMLDNQGKDYGKNTRYSGQTVIVEYSDPNPFKVLHAGHLYTSVVGDAIANLTECAGGKVHAVNFGGDVGMHVGKTMWAILKRLGGEEPQKLQEIPESDRSDWLAAAYVEGNNVFEDDDASKREMVALNKQIYQIHSDEDHSSPLAQIYWTCRQWSYDYFDAFYDRIGSRFAAEKRAGKKYYYPESEVADLGLATVRGHIGKVFIESEGAIVFDGEAHGLHTRVFINSEGIPTYETKDVGLILQKKQDFNFDRSIVITGNEQMQYMTVVLKAIEQFEPELARATTHLTHGIVKLVGGEKMSSRKGNILRAVDMLDAAAEANKSAGNEVNEIVTLGAVKYSLLKQRLGGDIIYSPEESVSLHGNSGPYLQYAYVRALKILQNTESKDVMFDSALEPQERSLLLKLTEFPEVVDRATEEFAPHYVCGYLYELAQVFNNFYEHNRVLGDERQRYRVLLVSAYVAVLQNGLTLLGISTPESM